MSKIPKPSLIGPCGKKTCPLGLMIRLDSNQPDQLQRLAKTFEILDIETKGIIPYSKQTTKGMISLC